MDSNVKAAVITGICGIIAAVIAVTPAMLDRLPSLEPEGSAETAIAAPEYSGVGEADNETDAGELVDIGLKYAKGDGVEQDYSKAREYWEQAAEIGNATALFNLGLLYSNGYGVPQNYETARMYYEQAAEMGNAMAFNNLGDMYEYGYGVKQNYSTAEWYYEQAIERGETKKAPENLARVREKMNQS